VNGTIFYKMSGSGNDFVFVDGRGSPAISWTPEAIRAVCRPHTGVGADGLSVLEPGSTHGAVRLQYFNSDGGRASLCGNSALCATRLAAWLDLAPADGMILETDAGSHQSRCLPGSGERAEVALGKATAVTSPALDLTPGERMVRLATVGVPHLVVFVADLPAVDVFGRGRALRSHPSLGPAGANVNFVAKDKAGAWAMRTYERGVEAETLACGTGAAASAAVVSSTGEASLPWLVRTSSGADLGVRASNGAGPDSGTLWLSGEGRMVFRGVLGF
jgi:diaminopimelate epimerase